MRAECNIRIRCTVLEVTALRLPSTSELIGFAAAPQCRSRRRCHTPLLKLHYKRKFTSTFGQYECQNLHCTQRKIRLGKDTRSAMWIINSYSSIRGVDMYDRQLEIFWSSTSLRWKTQNRNTNLTIFDYLHDERFVIHVALIFVTVLLH